MTLPKVAIPTENLMPYGSRSTQTIHYQISPEELVKDTVRRGEGILNDTGALVIRTGEFTGRSPKDKFTVKDEITAMSPWTGMISTFPIESNYFDIIFKKITNYLDFLPEIWVRDALHAPIPGTASISGSSMKNPGIICLHTICFCVQPKMNWKISNPNGISWRYPVLN